jgi:hypothetical protein
MKRVRTDRNRYSRGGNTMGITRTTRLLARNRPASRQHPAIPGRPKRAVRSAIWRASSLVVSTLVIAALAMVGAPTAALAHTAAASAQWRLQNTTAHPPAGLMGTNMAADPANGTVVLFGGSVECDPSACNNQTWTWDGTDWTQQHPKHSPDARGSAAMAYDPATRTVVLFGGWTVDFTPNPPNVAYFDDTWTWNGTDWTQQFPADHPDARLTNLATDPATRSVLLEGGQHTDPTLCPAEPVGCLFAGAIDTWTWNGRDWTQRHPATQPTLGAFAAFASDPATRTVVLFGGGDVFAGPQSDQTWTWNGRDWSQQFPRDHPTARTGNGLAYDPATRRLVLFGGAENAAPPSMLPVSVVTGDTWTWDGRDWTQQQPLSSPSPRAIPGMATDPATCSVVLFGGADSSTNLGDTWVYASSPGAPDQFDQPGATQHEHEGAPNCSPRED